MKPIMAEYPTSPGEAEVRGSLGSESSKLAWLIKQDPPKKQTETNQQKTKPSK